jgi:hypothetical protein
LLNEDLRHGVELSKNRPHGQEVFVPHANAALAPHARLKLAGLIVDEGWPISRAAERYDRVVADRGTMGWFYLGAMRPGSAEQRD